MLRFTVCVAVLRVPATVVVLRPVVNVALVARWIVKLVGLVGGLAQVSVAV